MGVFLTAHMILSLRDVDVGVNNPHGTDVVPMWVSGRQFTLHTPSLREREIAVMIQCGRDLKTAHFEDNLRRQRKKSIIRSKVIL